MLCQRRSSIFLIAHNFFIYIARDSRYCSQTSQTCLTSRFFRNNDTRILAGVMVHREFRKWTTTRFGRCFCERSVIAKPSSSLSNTHCTGYCAIISESSTTLARERKKAARWKKSLSISLPRIAIDTILWFGSEINFSSHECEKR